MKRHWIAAVCLVALGFLAGCDTDKTPVFGIGIIPVDSSAVPALIRQEYRQDAARLTLRHMLRSGSADSSTIELNATLWQAAYMGLLHIYLASEQIPACDSVTRLFAIHTFPNPPLDAMIVGLDTTVAWTRFWLNKQNLTGKPEVDDLVRRYNLTITHVSVFPNALPFVVVKSGHFLNTVALSKVLEGIQGILFAGPDWAIGDGSDIRLDDPTEGLRYHFSIGWGDCPSGCIYRHTWHIAVATDGRVTYLGSSGPPLPIR